MSLTSPSTVFLVDTTQVQSPLLKHALEDENFQVVDHTSDIINMVDKVAVSNADIVVLSTDSPNQELIHQLSLLNRRSPKPVIMFAEQDAPAVIEEVVKSGVSAYVAAEVHPHRIRSIITVAVARFKEQQNLLVELNKAKNQLAGRKIIDRAKGLLMDQQGINEEEAYSKLRKMAMDKGEPLSNVAQSVVDVLSL
ncbi:ANTAR domain-containing response regulator [Litoribrevibacter albus]|uniref:Transcriptional regulator n=1 Tax=Litoribrevibacter albus TaxID=1473156 RepID=A0AA37SE62_9GAMM|nr:ANTAR domain-containing protein [Litoribrevibacter albus]GLQ33410.1 transcriptional regulator [Litoribrevibacter albus]